MNDFIAIDVETANGERSSICAIGAVKVVGGEIVDSRYSLVKPEPDYYHWANRRVHGLGPDDTCGAPTFDKVWNSWRDWIGTLPLVAHNAMFDSSCIKAACRVYRLDEPTEWFCTLQQARRVIPRAMLQSKSLDSLCDFFAIPLDNHHCAKDDALACARLAQVLFKQQADD